MEGAKMLINLILPGEAMLSPVNWRKVEQRGKWLRDEYPLPFIVLHFHLFNRRKINQRQELR